MGPYTNASATVLHTCEYFSAKMNSGGSSMSSIISCVLAYFESTTRLIRPPISSSATTSGRNALNICRKNALSARPPGANHRHAPTSSPPRSQRLLAAGTTMEFKTCTTVSFSMSAASKSDIV